MTGGTLKLLTWSAKAWATLAMSTGLQVIGIGVLKFVNYIVKSIPNWFDLEIIQN